MHAGPLPCRTPFLIRASSLALVLFCSCGQDEEPVPIVQPPPVTSVTDVDGNSYGVVLIGQTYWMNDDLRTLHFRDGSEVPYVSYDAAWAGLDSAAYGIHPTFFGVADGGGLWYNWFAVNDTRGLCPAGWHVPSTHEWAELELALGMPADELLVTDFRGYAQNVGGKLKTTNLDGGPIWTQPNTGATNEVGFNARPRGYRELGGAFVAFRVYGSWWTSSPIEPNKAWSRSLYYQSAGILLSGNLQRRSGLCVRCVMD